MPSSRRWQGSTDGTRWMQEALIRGFRFLPLGVYYAAVALTVPFYMLFGSSFRPSYGFYRRRLGLGAVRALWLAYKNHYRFGTVMIDRFACYAGRKFRMEIENYEAYAALDAAPGPFIMLSAHVGGYEIAGYSLTANKPINALVYMGETETVMKNREIQFGRTRIRMVPLAADMSHLYALHAAMERGEIVSMPADRSLGSEKTVTCRFFGATARFPLGAFATTATYRAPVLQVFVMKEGTHRYRTFVLPIHATGDTRKARIESLAQQYADNIERVVRCYPEQWFNFYDFWQSSCEREQAETRSNS